MPYIVDPTDAATPTNSQGATQGGEEFRLLKARVNALAASVGAASSVSDFRNRLGNPNWLLDQINEGAAYTVNSATVQGPDFWSGIATGAGAFTMQQVADPDFPTFKALKLACTTADASLAATDAYRIYTAIEGNMCRDLEMGTATAKEITISFASKMGVAGVYGVAIRNDANNRVYVGSFTQAIANTRETQTITLTLDLTGTWEAGTSAGIVLIITLAAGTDFQTATTNAWQGTANVICPTTQANFMSVNTNVGYIGRIKLEKGSYATVMDSPDIQKDLEFAQRYYEKTFNQGTAVAQACGTFAGTLTAVVPQGDSLLSFHWSYATVKRAEPGIITYNPTQANAFARNFGDSLDSTGTTGTTAGMSGFGFYAGGAASQNPYGIHVTSNARLA